MKFRNEEYNKLVVEQHRRVKEVTVIVTPYCEGGCKHCLYHRDRIGDREWVGLWENVVGYFSSLCHRDEKAIIAIEGGEVFSEKLVTDADYVNQLRTLVKYLHNLVEDTGWYLACSISPENIEDTGIKLLLEFKEKYPKLHLNIAFSVHRFNRDEKEARFWKNIEALRDKPGREQLGIGVLMTEGFPERFYLRKLAEYASSKVIDFAESHLFEGNCFSYKGINATEVYRQTVGDLGIKIDPCLRRGMPSLHHLDVYVTSRGVFNGFHFLRRPHWVPEADWNRIRDDEEYRVFGYQQVLDWYGCNDCPHLLKCQGMLWTSYFAQKNLYEYKECLYK